MTGELHAFAGITNISYDLYREQLFGYTGGAEALTEYGDTLYFHVAGALPTTLTTISFSISAHSSWSYISGIVEGCCVPSGFYEFEVANHGNDGGLLYKYQQNVTLGWGSDSEWGYSGSTSSDGTTNDNFTLDGSFTMQGANAAVPVELETYIHGGVGVADVGDTISFQFDSLPAGVTYTSASGVFLKGSTAISEPPSFIIVLTGVSFLALLLYARRQCPGSLWH